MRPEKIKFKSKWFNYEHTNPSSKGMYIAFVLIIALTVITCLWIRTPSRNPKSETFAPIVLDPLFDEVPP